MPDIDPLAFGIRFALTHETVGREAKKLIRSLSERDLEHLSMQVAKHLRLCGWRQIPPTPLATGDQFPGGGRETGTRQAEPSKEARSQINEPIAVNNGANASGALG
jgi:hypothetical protein